MATITTTTHTTVFSYPSRASIDRSPYSGALVTVVRKSAGAIGLFTSSNNGASWSDANCDFTRTGLQEWSNIYIDGDGYAHLAYRVYESGQDKIYYRRASANSSGVLSWESEVLVRASAAASAGATHQGVDIVVVKIGATYYVHFAVGHTVGSTVGVSLFSMTIRIEYSWWILPYWSFTVTNNLIQGSRQWLATGTGRVTPSIDLRHNGSGHAASTPDLFVSWGRSTVYMQKLPYASGRWTGGATPVNVGTATANMDSVPGRFDGTRFLVCVYVNDTVSVYERDVSNTSANIRTSPPHTTGNIRHVAIDYTPTTGDFRLFAVGTSTDILYYIDFVRATGSWSSWVSTALTIVGVHSFGVRRSSYGNARYDLVTQTGTSPYTLSHTAYTIPFSPDTPTISSPITGATKDVAATLPFTWAFTDTDPGDTQSAYALSRQIGAGTLAYWRASDSTWQAGEVQNSTATQGVTLPTAWGLDADDTHTYRVKVWDSTGLPSAYSTGVQIIPSAKINPTLSTPVGGSTLIYNFVVVSWTVASQQAFRVRLSTGGVYVYDSGWRVSTFTSFTPEYTLLDNTSYTVELTTRNAEGLDSDTVSASFSVDFIEPATPTITPIAAPEDGLINLYVTNPEPSGQQPIVASNHIFRRLIGGTDAGTRITTVSASAGLTNKLPSEASSLESTPIGWIASISSPTVARSTDTAYNGTYSLKMTATAANTQMWAGYVSSTAVPVVPGTVYRFKARFKAATTGRAVRLSAAWYNTVPANVATSNIDSTDVTSGWTLVSGTVTAHANAATVFLFIQIFGSNLVIGEVHYIDEIFFGVEVTPAPSTYADFMVASGVDYEYRVQANGVNGTSTYSGWSQ